MRHRGSGSSVYPVSLPKPTAAPRLAGGGFESVTSTTHGPTSDCSGTHARLQESGSSAHAGLRTVTSAENIEV